jgi:hypothetical protein
MALAMIMHEVRWFAFLVNYSSSGSMPLCYYSLQYYHQSCVAVHVVMEQAEQWVPLSILLRRGVKVEVMGNTMTFIDTKAM